MITPVQPTPAQIEAIARAEHGAYLAALPDLSPDELGQIAANAPWEDLTDHLRELNYAQVRDNIAKFAARGYVVVAHTTTYREDPWTALGIDEDARMALAREEHDRWASQKRRQGYLYGPVRCDSPPDLRHPNLLEWDQLPAPTRQKDIGAIERFPGHLQAVGLTLIRSA